MLKLFSEHQKLSVHTINGICDCYKCSSSQYNVQFKIGRHSNTENVWFCDECRPVCTKYQVDNLVQIKNHFLWLLLSTQINQIVTQLWFHNGYLFKQRHWERKVSSVSFILDYSVSRKQLGGISLSHGCEGWLGTGLRFGKKVGCAQQNGGEMENVLTIRFNQLRDNIHKNNKHTQISLTPVAFHAYTWLKIKIYLDTRN